jgi:hypothetical protein
MRKGSRHVRAVLTLLVLVVVAVPARGDEPFTASGAWRTPTWVRSASDGFVHIIDWSWASSASYANGQSAWVRLGKPATANTLARNSTFLEAVQFGFHIPSRAVIRGVSVEIVARAGRQHAKKTTDEAVLLMLQGFERGTNHAVFGTLPRRLATLAYGGDDDLWGLDEKLTPEQVNDPLFGVAFAIRSPQRPAAGAVDAMRIAVFYDLP